jgi:hypothetical protein
MKYFLLILVCFIAISCEKEIPFDNKDYSQKLNVYSIISPDSEMIVRVGKTELLYSGVTPPLYDIDSLNVELSINEEEYLVLQYYKDEDLYMVDKKPHVGDVVKLRIRDLKGHFPTVTSETHIPTIPNLKVEDIRKEYRYNVIEHTNPLELEGGKHQDDTVAIIKCKLSDLEYENNYYSMTLVEKDFPSISNCFDSDDPIFSDNRVTSSIDYMPIGFSNYFDDSIFNGQEYNFLISTFIRVYGRSESKPIKKIIEKYILSIQSLSKSAYLYHKSLLYARCSAQDIFAQPVSIYSNIENGYGVFGSVATVKDTISVDCYNTYVWKR